MSIFSDIKKYYEKMEAEAQAEKEKKEREKKRQERIKKAEHEKIIREIRDEYIQKLPFKSVDVIAMRYVTFGMTIFFQDAGVEFFTKYGNRCFLSNTDHSKKSKAAFFLTAYNPEDICEVLSCVIPRLADRNLHLSDDPEYNDIYYPTKWKYLSVDEKYLKVFVNDKEIVNLNEELYRRLVGVVDSWEYMGESELLKELGSNIYTSWSKKLEPCRIVVEERRERERRQQEKVKAEKEKEEAIKQRQLAEEKRRKEKEKEEEETKKKLAELHAMLDEKHAEEERRELERKEQIIAAGKKGEEEVNYALKWLDKSYQVLKSQADKIKIKNIEFMDEAQEYDHIVVGPIGVILIETKAYSGRINIDKAGNWTRYKNEEWVGVTNPIQQVRRHEKLIRSFIPNNIPIHSYICLANSSVVIEGSENSIVPIVKSDLLVEYIEKEEVKTALTREEIDKCVQLILGHMVQEQ